MGGETDAIRRPSLHHRHVDITGAVEDAVANRPVAVHWLDDLEKTTSGAIRPVSPAQHALIQEVITSDTPHRYSRVLGEMHDNGEICAGLIREASDVRAMLDRLHVREPLFFAAFQALLTHHLIDMIVLLRQIIPEDVALKNEIVKAGLSVDPFLQSRQDATAEIRNYLLQFHVINRLDQQKNTAISNPYAAYLEIARDGDRITAPIDGIAVSVPRQHYLDAIHSVRRSLYDGESFGNLDTQAPWMNARIAQPFRFIKQHVDRRSELAPLDTLYMLERAAESRR
jgi:hypothetical protein